ncbi:hypothetical protein [Acinetobacter junii]|uniref:hypothetical protein n=1 Tax=Acinetobacter junii TaxID=40215 RepID=UPI001BA49ED4|nr:hypothetical protein [Acinetobacter junii]QUS48769.1 hypothetical protein J5N61_09455 [Acinetobacter junii]
MNNNFIDYTTGGAFNLNLSRRQIESFTYFASTDQFVHVPSKSTQALIDKGLLESVPVAEACDPNYPCLRITAEGKLVWELLKMAGLAKELPRSIWIPAPEVDFKVTLKEKVDAEG